MLFSFLLYAYERLHENKHKYSANKSDFTVILLTLDCATCLPSQKAGTQGFNYSYAAMLDSILLE